MKTKLKTALKSNVDPFFFALTCAMLICLSLTAKALAHDALTDMGSGTYSMSMTADGQVTITPE